MKELKVKTTHTINNFVDTNTGEVIKTDQDVKHDKIIVNGKEEFAVVYSAVISATEGLPPSTKALLIHISLKASVDSNEITLVKPVLEKLSKESEMSLSAIKKGISQLVDKKILIRIGSGLYRVNPKYYWRGSLANRNKTMKYVLEVECPNC